MSIREIVHIEWEDAAGGHRSGWRPVVGMANSLITCHSVGFIVAEDDDKVLLCPHWSEDGDGDAEIAIPRKWIIKVIPLQEAATD